MNRKLYFPVNIIVFMIIDIIMHKLFNTELWRFQDIVMWAGIMTLIYGKTKTSHNKDCAVTPSASPKSSDDDFAQS